MEYSDIATSFFKYHTTNAQITYSEAQEWYQISDPLVALPSSQVMMTQVSPVAILVEETEEMKEGILRYSLWLVFCLLQ